MVPTGLKGADPEAESSARTALLNIWVLSSPRVRLVIATTVTSGIPAIFDCRSSRDAWELATINFYGPCRRNRFVCCGSNNWLRAAGLQSGQAWSYGRGGTASPLVAQKISPISTSAALNPCAASMSTFCLACEPSLQAFHTFSCRSGWSARCSGLK